MATTVNNTMVKIQTVTVGSGGAAQIDFDLTGVTGYTDLLIKVSARDDRGADWTSVYVKFNDSTTNFTNRHLYGIGSGGGYSTNYSTGVLLEGENASTTTLNVFSNYEIYIPNYTSSNYKSWSVDSVTENNATTSYQEMVAGLWSNTAAITKVSILLSGSIKFVQNTTATLYGITATPNTTKASGGIIYQDATYMYHVFPYTSTFTPSTSLSCDVLTIAGGGGGGSHGGNGYSGGGGGGAGGVYYASSQTFSTAQTVTVGAGGTGGVSNTTLPAQGNNSSVGSLTAAVGGGRGAVYTLNSNGGNGGSGGGATWATAGSHIGTAGTGTSGQGNNGGNNPNANDMAGGGGGAGAAGSNSGSGSSGAGGAGGIGITTYSSWAIATNTGEIVSGTGYYAGGGAGGGYTSASTSLGGLGGGGKANANANGSDGLALTGGGGGASQCSIGGTEPARNGGNGGSGVVIIRYAK